ncbi:MAG: hypothetical protein K2G69_02930 [Muribaculaceae bacterium]|nr:hypothetical protein [Muribaculaceae bacterium]
MKHTLLTIALVGLGTMGMWAQNSLPAPGSGGSFNPAPIGGNPGPGPAMGPGPGMGMGLGPGWGWGGGPAPMNQGTVNVVATGYDNFGRLRNIPMNVAYTFSYGQYDVTVLAAYNPFTMMWNPNLNVPAYNTSYFLNGNTYNFYVPLSTGTYYFNL